MNLIEFSDELTRMGITNFREADNAALVCGILAGDDSEVFSTRFGRRVKSCLLSNNITLIDCLFVRSFDRGWEFVNDTPIVVGSESLDRISCHRTALDDLLPICVDYLTKAPIHILDWVIPIYQQPSWSLEKVRFAVKNSTLISESEIDQIISMRRTEAHIKQADCPGLNYALDFAEFFYYQIHGTSIADGNLFLRYDLDHAYVVPVGCENSNQV